MAFKDRLILETIRVLPEKRLSRGMRKLVSVESAASVRWFAARYGIDLDEAEKPIEEYRSILDLFTRRLKPGLRPIDPDPTSLVCPVDGVLDSFGTIEDGTLLQAKGHNYRLADLLADEARAERYAGGSFATLYLSPRDYHRVHCPADARVVGATYVPGTLFPVNAAAVQHVGGLFAKNERLVTHLESERFGGIEYVMVGATNVGHMRVTYDDSLVTNVGGRAIERKTYEPATSIGRGEELGVFEMGSTVVLVVEPKVRLDPGLARGLAVRYGMRLGTA